MSVSLHTDPSRISNFLTGDNAVDPTTNAAATMAKALANRAHISSLPAATQGFNLSELDEKPSLKNPSVRASAQAEASMTALSGLGTEALMMLLGFEERKSVVNSGKASIAAHREEREEVNKQRIEKLQEQAEKLEQKGLLDKLKKAFGVIGCILGAIASIATAVVGVVTANPLMVVGAAMVMVVTVDQAVQLGTNGEKGIVQSIVATAEKNGSDVKASMIAAQVMTIAMGVVGAIFSAGAGSANVGGAAKALTTVTNTANGLNTVASGTTQIASSVVDYKLDKLKADGKELEAILMRIQMASDIDTQQLKNIMEKTENMTQSVKEILESCNQSLAGILTSNTAHIMA